MEPDSTKIEFHEYFATMAPGDAASLLKKKVELEILKIEFCVM